MAAAWARRAGAARSFAAEHGTEAVPSFEELLDAVDAMAFAVPPSVQWSLAS